MNFLSHFYFERKANDAQRTLGSVLPDLLRNMNRDIHVFPEKEPAKYLKDEKLAKIYKGWIRHIETDRIFHNSVFFVDKTQQLKAHLMPVVANTQVRGSFLSHIALELLLDRQLLKDSWLHEDDFYNQLSQIDKESLKLFLNLTGIEDPSSFIIFFNSFITDKYLGSYRNMTQVAYALDQICRRFWPKGLGEHKKIQLTEALNDYEIELAHNYKSIFNEISDYLTKKHS